MDNQNTPVPMDISNDQDTSNNNKQNVRRSILESSSNRQGTHSSQYLTTNPSLPQHHQQSAVSSLTQSRLEAAGASLKAPPQMTTTATSHYAS